MSMNPVVRLDSLVLSLSDALDIVHPDDVEL